MDYQYSGIESPLPASSSPSSSLASTLSWTTPPRDPSSFKDMTYISGSRNVPAGPRYYCSTSNGGDSFTSLDTYGTQPYGDGMGLAPNSSHYLEDGREHDGDALGRDGDSGFQLYRNMESGHREGQDVTMQDNAYEHQYSHTTRDDGSVFASQPAPLTTRRESDWPSGSTPHYSNVTTLDPGQGNAIMDDQDQDEDEEEEEEDGEAEVEMVGSPGESCYSAMPHNVEEPDRKSAIAKLEAEFQPGQCSLPGCKKGPRAYFFNTFQSYRSHLKNVHSKSLLCTHPSCSHTRPFSSQTDLNRHALRHGNKADKPYKCLMSNCSARVKDFKRKDKLREHSRRYHSDYACFFCSRDPRRGRWFETFEQVVEHTNTEHTEHVGHVPVLPPNHDHCV